MMKKFAILLALCLALPVATSAQGAEVPEGANTQALLDLGIGYRADKLDWNIASDATGAATPNILSELTWDGLQILQLDGGAQIRFGRIVLKLAAGYGWIVSGDNQDSDFLGNNRTGEFSRSNNDAGAGSVWDLSAAIGYRFGEDAFLTPLVGWSVDRQNLRIRNGFQTIATVGLTPPVGPFSGLNSTYDAQWTGPWLGFDAGMVRGDTNFFLKLAFHFTDYSAEANWNLRTDLAHPVSFRHDATGYGIDAGLGMERHFSDNLSLLAAINYRKWKADNGTYTRFASTGSISTIKLNEVNWQSAMIRLDARYAF